GTGRDRLSGGSFGDELYGGPGKDHLLGDSGTDRLESGGGADLLVGGRQHDLLISTGGRGQLSGGSGHDVLDVSLRSDRLPFVLDGGPGRDYLSLLGRVGVVLDLETGHLSAPVVGSAAVRSIESAMGGSGADAITG